MREQSKITLDQRAYIERNLERFGMADCNSCQTPLETKMDYAALNSDIATEAPCRSLLGCLMYISSNTRPDIALAVNVMSRYVNKNNNAVWVGLKKILRYLSGTKDLKLTYRPQKIESLHKKFTNVLEGYADANYMSRDDFQPYSTCGYLFYAFGNMVSWAVKKQSIVATSTTEAEYVALYEAAKEFSNLKYLCQSLGISINLPCVIHEDNKAVVEIAKNPSHHGRTKHFNPKFHYTRELVQKNDIAVVFTSSGEQTADALTKGLPVLQHLHIIERMGLQ